MGVLYLYLFTFGEKLQLRVFCHCFLSYSSSSCIVSTVSVHMNPNKLIPWRSIKIFSLSICNWVSDLECEVSDVVDI
jgi:hypothetical protein